MGEIEGHYQPVLKKTAGVQSLKRLKSPLLHHAYEDSARWNERHVGYAMWERGMNEKEAWPDDPVEARGYLKSLFRAMPFRGSLFFVYYYLFKGGFLEGRSNFDLTAKKKKYYDTLR